MDNVIKTIIPATCPHCSKQMFVEFMNRAPELTSVYGEDAVHAAKDDVRTQIKNSPIPEERKKEILEWVDSQETIFGPSEVKAIVDNALKVE